MAYHHNDDEEHRLRSELQELIAAEELEIKLLTYATGITADVARAIRSELVKRLKTILREGQ